MKYALLITLSFFTLLSCSETTDMNRNNISLSSLSTGNSIINVASQVSFSIVDNEGFSSQIISLQNPTNNEMTYDLIEPEGSFYLVSNTCPPTIAEQSNYDLIVEYRPSPNDDGVQNDALIVFSNNRYLSIPLQGSRPVPLLPPRNGGSPELTISSRTYASSELLKEVELTNSGNTSLENFQLNGSNYLLFANFCPNNLEPNNSCFMIVSKNKNSNSDSLRVSHRQGNSNIIYLEEL